MVTDNIRLEYWMFQEINEWFIMVTDNWQHYAEFPFGGNGVCIVIHEQRTLFTIVTPRSALWWEVGRWLHAGTTDVIRVKRLGYNVCVATFLHIYCYTYLWFSLWFHKVNSCDDVMGIVICEQLYWLTLNNS